MILGLCGPMEIERPAGIVETMINKTSDMIINFVRLPIMYTAPITIIIMVVILSVVYKLICKEQDEQKYEQKDDVSNRTKMWR